MTTQGDFGPSVPMQVVRVKRNSIERTDQPIATEIPFTISANGTEIVTLLCSPSELRELTTGYLYTSGLIAKASDVLEYSCDTKRWLADISLARDPDPKILEKRLYTSGCGKGVMYASIAEVSSRRPIETDLTVTREQVTEVAIWLQRCSELYRETGAVHTAALSVEGAIPQIWCDDVGRHNAVDKVIGTALADGIDLSRCVMVSSGRTSSEILHKAKRANISVSISRGAPTHQTILRARDMGVTIVGFARGGGFTVYSHEKRVAL